jgi:hypothetical protein
MYTCKKCGSILIGSLQEKCRCGGGYNNITNQVSNDGGHTISNVHVSTTKDGQVDVRHLDPEVAPDEL